LATERTANAALRRIIAELSLELDQTTAELASKHNVTRLQPRGAQTN
jgi:hypothetical protein